MPTITKEEELIIREIFSGKASISEFEIIKRCIVEAKERRGIYSEVVKFGPDLHSSTASISEVTGINKTASGCLSRVLWMLVRSKTDNARQMKLGIDKATWIYESYLCKHSGHSMLNGKEFSIRKGVRVGLFRRIHAGELVGCGCMSKPILPF